ncbi:hypothetical protein GMB51_13245 [Turicibacter sanguinis]|uniref:hypothetical protein n=1 Tax=Turicibacter sanguinis TaxID=154288 RepID=UPI0012BC4712|nr:hypothetical protein [Turicibacter sanguinis]MDB8562378.1 hypothetical protein [Turicibacter sanguinis]MTN46129.1 hypothetical protein [Turicibacter sanguinis]MTN51971.1 hypothetical protein [Turicibacter sanguinis]MTN55020.1 hypothetical protein [Turicibacter sanguinis]MTN58236.1 hypothetical protein [Turicibacter sanguinis]
MHIKTTILTFFFIIASFFFLFTDTMIGQAIPTENQQISDEFSPMASITFNQTINVIDSDYEKVTLDQINEISSLDSVQEVEYHLAIELYSQMIKVPNQKVDDQSLTNRYTPISQISVGGVASSFFSLINEQIIQIEAGRSFQKDELLNIKQDKVPVLVSEDFAKLNHLEVGSEFNLDNNVYFLPLHDVDWDFDEVYADSNILTKETYEVYVIGIFKPKQSEAKPINNLQCIELSNTIFAPETFVESALEFSQSNAYHAFEKTYQNESWWATFKLEYQFNLINQKASQPLFILKDSADWKEFESEANKILSPSHQVKKASMVEDLLLF